MLGNRIHLHLQLKVKKIIILILVLSSLAFSILNLGNWKLKEDAYSIQFNGTKVDGFLEGLKTTLVFDKDRLENSKFIATIDAKTINTGNWLKNRHAASKDALDAEHFPIIKFESTKITVTNEGYNAVGQLTLKGITKTINLPFSFLSKGNEAVFKGSIKLSPKDYNITRNGTPEIIEVEILVPVTN